MQENSDEGTTENRGAGFTYALGGTVVCARPTGPGQQRLAGIGFIFVGWRVGPFF